jgi:GT2 family glycosyltransferase
VEARESPSASIVLVSFDSAPELRRTLPALLAELGDGDEVIVVDNGSADDTEEVVRTLAPEAILLPMRRNAGFAAAANAGAKRASRELLVVLNPDAMPLLGFGAAIRRPLAEGRGWDAWQALVACEDGTRVNSWGNPLHFTGITWAGGHGERLPARPQPREIAVASGACLAVPRERWLALGGFPEAFFLYHEDVDLSMRIHLEGGRVGIEPAAVVDHDYEFAGSEQKWRWLERNRLAFVLRVYPGPLLVLLLPALLATELVLLPVSIAGGWGRRKLLSYLDVLRRLPHLLRERRAIQRARRVSAGEFAAWLTPDLESPFIGGFARRGPVRGALRLYWRLVRSLLR